MPDHKCSNLASWCVRKDQEIARLQEENKLLKEKLVEREEKSDEHAEIRRLHEYEELLR